MWSRNMITAIVKGRDSTSARTRESFEVLMRNSYRQAFSLAYRLTGNKAEAEDLVQESYLRAYRFFHRYDDALPFTSWLYRIMTNAHIDSVRRKSRIKTTSLDQPMGDHASAWELPSNDDRPGDAMLAETMDAPVQEALKSIKPEFRMAVLLADVDGMAYEEIAEVMQTSVGTVRSRIHRGRTQLRKRLLQMAPDRFREANHDLR